MEPYEWILTEGAAFRWETIPADSRWRQHGYTHRWEANLHNAAEVHRVGYANSEEAARKDCHRCVDVYKGWTTGELTCSDCGHKWNVRLAWEVFDFERPTLPERTCSVCGGYDAGRLEDEDPGE